MKPALLIIDVLQDFFRGGRLAEHRARLVAATNELADPCRDRNVPVIWVRQEFKADLARLHCEGDRVTCPNHFHSESADVRFSALGSSKTW